jgi:hypothetical protein
MENLQQILFENSEQIPNGIYVQLMDEFQKVYKYVKSLENFENFENFEPVSESDSDYESDSETDVDEVFTEVIDEYYHNGYFDFDKSVIMVLKNFYTIDQIYYKFNSVFINNYFYCKKFDVLIDYRDYKDDDNFVVSDTFYFNMNTLYFKMVDTDVKNWVNHRFQNVLNNFS